MSLWTKGRILLFILSISSFSQIATAANFNVSNATELQNALNTAQANGAPDVIHLAGGSYDTTVVGGSFIYNSAENYSLTLQGPDSGPAAVIDGQNTYRCLFINTQPLSDDSNADVEISNLELIHGAASGSPGGAGLRVQTSNADITVSGSSFEQNAMSGITGDGAGLSLETSFGGDITLEHNILTNNSTSVSSSGVGATLVAGRDPGGTGQVLVNANLFHHNTSGPVIVAGGGLYAQAKSQILLTNNIFSDNALTGSSTNGGGAYLLMDGAHGNIDLVNNTFYHNSAGFEAGGVFLAFTGISTNSIGNVYNNIFFHNSSPGADDLFVGMSGSPAGARLNHFNNDIFNLVQQCAAPACIFGEGNNISEDPRFADVASGNFSLENDSPALNAGLASAPSLPTGDFSGNSRHQGSAPEMGALESAPPATPGAPPPPALTGGSPAGAAPGSGGGCSLGVSSPAFAFGMWWAFLPAAALGIRRRISPKN